MRVLKTQISNENDQQERFWADKPTGKQTVEQTTSKATTTNSYRSPSSSSSVKPGKQNHNHAPPQPTSSSQASDMAGAGAAAVANSPLSTVKHKTHRFVKDVLNIFGSHHHHHHHNNSTTTNSYNANVSSPPKTTTNLSSSTPPIISSSSSASSSSSPSPLSISSAKTSSSSSSATAQPLVINGDDQDTVTTQTQNKPNEATSKFAVSATATTETRRKPGASDGGVLLPGTPRQGRYVYATPSATTPLPPSSSSDKSQAVGHKTATTTATDAFGAFTRFDSSPILDSLSFTNLMAKGNYSLILFFSFSFFAGFIGGLIYLTL